MADHEKVYSIKFDVTKSLAALGKFNKRLEKTEVLVKRIRKAAGPMFRSMSRGYKKLGRAVDQVDRKTKKLGKSAINTSKQIQKAARKSKRAFDGIGKRASALGSTMTRRVTLPIAIAGVASLKFARDLNKAMAVVGTLIPGQTERIEELKKGVQDLAIETGASTSDIAEGVYAAISAWGDGADTMDRMRVAVQAAQAGKASPAATLALLTSLTEIYGDSSAEATEHVADLAFVTNKLAIKAPFEEMAASMGRVAPLAKQLDVSMEEMFATLTAGAGVTGTVSEVATQMSSLYTAVIKETPAMSAAVAKSNKELGTSYKSAADMLGKMGTVKFLKQLEKLSKGDTRKFAKILGGRKEGLVLALSLLGGRAEKYTEALVEMETKTGQMKVAHREITEGINKQGHEWEITKARMLVFAQRVGDKLLPVMERLFKAIEPILKTLEKMDPATLEWGIKIAGLLAIIGPGLKIFAGLSTVFGLIKAGALGIIGTSAGMTRFMTTQGANATTLTAKMGTLARSIGAVAIAAAAGYAVGTVISETIVDPAAKKKSKREDVEENVVRRAKEAVKHGSVAEKAEAQRALLAHYGKKKKQGQRAFQIDDPMETLASKIMGTESPAQKQKRLLKEGVFAAKQLAYQGRQRQRAGDINLTVNAPGGDPKVIAKEVEKSMGKALRRGAQGIGMGEQ